MAENRQQRGDARKGRLGQYETGKSCLYIKCLSDVKKNFLEELNDGSVRYRRSHYETG